MNNFRYGDRGINIGKCIMGVFMGDAVQGSEEFEAVGRLFLASFGVLCNWPINSLWTQRAYHTHNIQNIELTTTVEVLPSVWIVKITPKQIANKFIVKAHGIKATNNSIRSEDFLL